MTPALDRKEIVALVEEVMAAGARQAAACAELGRDARTLQRWKTPEGAVREDRRPFAERPVHRSVFPANRLTEAERDRIVDTCNAPRFASRERLRTVPRTVRSGCA